MEIFSFGVDRRHAICKLKRLQDLGVESVKGKDWETFAIILVSITKVIVWYAQHFASLDVYKDSRQKLSRSLDAG